MTREFLLLQSNDEQTMTIKSLSKQKLLELVKIHVARVDLRSSEQIDNMYLPESQNTHLMLVRDIVQLGNIKIKDLEHLLSHKEVLVIALSLNGGGYYHPLVFFCRARIRLLFKSQLIPVDNYSHLCDYLEQCLNSTIDDQELKCEIGYELCKYYFIVEDWKLFSKFVAITNDLLHKIADKTNLDIDLGEFQVFQKVVTIELKIFGYEDYLNDLFRNKIPQELKLFDGNDFDCIVLNLIHEYLANGNDTECLGLMTRRIVDLDLFKLSRIEEILEEIVTMEEFPVERRDGIYNIFSLLLYKHSIEDSDLKQAILESPIMTTFTATNHFLKPKPNSKKDRLQGITNQKQRQAILREFVITGMSAEEEKYIPELTQLVGENPVEYCPWLAKLGQAFFKRESFANSLQLAQMANLCIQMGPQPTAVLNSIQKLHHESVVSHILSKLHTVDSQQSSLVLQNLVETLKSIFFYDLGMLAKVVRTFIAKGESALIVGYLQMFGTAADGKEEEYAGYYCLGNCLLYFAAVIESLRIQLGLEKDGTIDFAKLGVPTNEFILQMAESAQLIQFLTKLTNKSQRKEMFIEIIAYLDDVKLQGLWPFIFGYLGGVVNSFLNIEEHLLLESLGPWSILTHGNDTRKAIDWRKVGVEIDPSLVIPVHPHNSDIALEFLEQALLHRCSKSRKLHHTELFMLGDLHRYRCDYRKAVIFYLDALIEKTSCFTDNKAMDEVKKSMYLSRIIASLESLGGTLHII